jgi:hypothetical protein
MCWTAICTYWAIPEAARVSFIYFTRKTTKKHFISAPASITWTVFASVRFTVACSLHILTGRRIHFFFCQSHGTTVSVFHQSPCRKSYEIVQIKLHAFWILRLDLLVISFASPPFPWDVCYSMDKRLGGPHSRSGRSREPKDDSRSPSTYLSNCTKLHRLID